jgi:transglutaminase-like putative cysteine protease
VKLDILHETVYDYDFPVDITQHLAHLKPNDCTGQQVLSARLTVSPEPDYFEDRTDIFGNISTFFSIESRHTRLKTVAKSVIETDHDNTYVQHDLISPSWEDVRNFYRYQAHQPIAPATDFIFSSPMILFDEAFVQFAKDCFSVKIPVLMAAVALMQKIHHELQYETASTDVNTLAIDSLKNRKGVCQDFAHIMISCLRMLGLPAQYVSGYMLTKPPPGKPRLIGSDASHAWIATYIPAVNGFPEAGWFHFDPTNNRWGRHAPGEEYVILSRGRDYADVSPIRGVIHGGGNHHLSVAVTVLPFNEKLLFV